MRLKSVLELHELKRDPRDVDEYLQCEAADDKLFDVLWENVAWHIRRALYLPIGSAL